MKPGDLFVTQLAVILWDRPPPGRGGPGYVASGVPAGSVCLVLACIDGMQHLVLSPSGRLGWAPLHPGSAQQL